ncbi:MAG: hypothetical protein ACJAWL_003363 [Motiliproteus sp.]|jgi:hypothetical protein
MNQDPVEQHPDYYAPSAYRSTHIPIMPPSSDSEHSPKFIGNNMTYGRFPWSWGSEQFFPVGGVQGQFRDLKFEHDKSIPDFYNQERILFFNTNRLANIVGTIHYISLMCVVGLFGSLFVSVVYLFKFGFNGYHEKLILPAAFLTAYFILNKGVKYFVEKKSICLQRKTAAFTAAPAWCGCG